MSKWYRLVALQDDDPLTIDIVSHEDYDFTLGARIQGAVPEPVIFEIDPEVGGPRVPTLFLPEPVFSARFVEALRHAGVTNLEDYSVRILRPDGTECDFGQAYRAVNIVGLVDCADLQRSEYEEVEGMLLFDHLVIDPARARGVDFFRVAHAEEYIVASQSLANRLDLEAFPDLALVPIET